MDLKPDGVEAPSLFLEKLGWEGAGGLRRSSRAWGQATTSWRQPEIWGNTYGLSDERQGCRKSEQGSRHLQLLRWPHAQPGTRRFPGQGEGLGPSAPRHVGVSAGEAAMEGRGDAAHSYRSAITKALQNKVPVVS